jgi:hypothetical protein
MRPWLAVVLLAGASAAGLVERGRSPEAAGVFSTTLPGAVGEVSSWEVITGSFETDAARGDYLFYVNPARSGLYQLMRYRVELRKPATPEEQRRGASERVAFIARPGMREPMLCWERLGGDAPPWREVAPGTPEYVMEMNVLLSVLAVHWAARNAP